MKIDLFLKINILEKKWNNASVPINYENQFLAAAVPHYNGSVLKFARLERQPERLERIMEHIER